MHFSKKEEDIYNSLVNSKIKDKKAVQVKYELTRPRKKQNKRGEVKAATVLNEYSTVSDNKEESDHIYSQIAPKPPPRWDSLPVKLSSNNYKENDNSVGPLINNQSDINLPLPLRSPPKPPILIKLNTQLGSRDPTTCVSEVTQDRSKEFSCAESDESSDIYAPWNWRQQNYETWTPSYKQHHYLSLPPPTKPPPKPPTTPSTNNLSDGCLADQAKKPQQQEEPKQNQPETNRNYEPWNWRQQNYESWTPNFQKEESETEKSSNLNNNLTELGNKFGKLKIPTRRTPVPPSKSISQQLVVSDSNIKSELSESHDHMTETTPKESKKNNSSNRAYEPWNWRRRMKEEGEEIYSPGQDLLPPAPSPPPVEDTFSRGPLRQSKSILKEKKDVPGEKKKRVRMLFPEDTVSPI